MSPLISAAIASKEDPDDEEDPKDKEKNAAVQQNAQKALDVVPVIVKRSGLNELVALGYSAIELEPGLIQSKAVAYKHPGQAQGVIWNLSGGNTPNALDFTRALPAQAAMASSFNLKLGVIWEALQAEAANNPLLKQTLNGFAQSCKATTELDLPALLASLGPNFSLLVTLDETRPVSLPLQGLDKPPMAIPAPGLALWVQVQDDLLIRRLETLLQQNAMFVRSEENGVTYYIMPALPIVPIPDLRLTVAWKPGLLMLASSDALLKEMLAIQADSKQGLAATPGFQKLTAGTPKTGFQFGYVSPQYMKMVNRLQANFHNDRSMEAIHKLIFQYLAQQGENCYQFSIVEESAEGWVVTERAQKILADKK